MAAVQHAAALAGLHTGEGVALVAAVMEQAVPAPRATLMTTPTAQVERQHITAAAAAELLPPRPLHVQAAPAIKVSSSWLTTFLAPRARTALTPAPHVCRAQAARTHMRRRATARPRVPRARSPT